LTVRPPDSPGAQSVGNVSRRGAEGSLEFFHTAADTVTKHLAAESGRDVGAAQVGGAEAQVADLSYNVMPL